LKQRANAVTGCISAKNPGIPTSFTPRGTSIST
jgi:hypothetical protein